jgi:two-component system, LytTR family, response regulator
MIWCIIIDKDTASRKHLETILREITHLALIKSCKNITEATAIIKNNKTDVLFIDMAGTAKDSLNFLDTLDYERPRIIVTAADTEDAKDAFDVDALDFVTKPITAQRMLKALWKVLNTPSQGIRGKENEAAREFFVKQNSHLEKIDVNTICRIEALADYVSLFTDGKRYIIHSTLKGIHSKLPDKDFVRVHKSHIVRVDRISKINGKNLEVEKHTVPLSHSFRKTLFERLNVI